MIHDLFIPCRIGNYYLHTQKVLTLEVTPIVIYGVLLEYSGQKIILKEKYSINLKENSTIAQINAIKKILSLVGKVDEIISISTTPAMIFKELQLPFLGRENLKMILPLEIENILPFSIDQASIDFIILQEDKEKKISTILVCAVRKQDIIEQYEFFKKADISLDMLTVDVFALYRLYQVYVHADDKQQKIKSSKTTLKEKLVQFKNRFYAIIFRKKIQNINESEKILQNFQAHKSEVLVDIGYSSIKVLYLKDDILSSVRVIPFGIGQLLEHANNQITKSYEDIVQSLSSDTSMDENLANQFKNIFEEIQKTLLFFQQEKGAGYLTPFKISMSGFFTNSTYFLDQAKMHLGSVVSSVDMRKCLDHAHVAHDTKTMLTSQWFNILSSALSWHYQPDNNLLEFLVQEKQQRQNFLQIITMVITGLLCISIIGWQSYDKLQKWKVAYSKSRINLINEIQNQMGIDLHSEKNLKNLVKKTEDVLKSERQLWFSFTQQHEASILEYLQDLSTTIDRDAVGLELKSLHIDYQKVIMVGTVKNFDALDLFSQELQELKLLKVIDLPRELSWNIELKPKISLKGAT